MYQNIQLALVLPFYFIYIRPADVNKVPKEREITLEAKRNENIAGTALHSTNLNIPVYPLETRKLHKMFQKRNQKRK